MSICDHRCVGALIQSEQGILLFQRNTPPAGVAGPAGHCDGDSFVEALIREVWEEVGLWVVRWRFLAEFYDANPCRREYEGEPGHHWQFFDVDVQGEIQASARETKNVRWYAKPELASLAVRTDQRLAGDISDEEWQQNPGFDLPWYRLLVQELHLIAVN
jgi:8-oxo-dGTP pyrophosphatase MutT (NUDIX family)